MNLQTQDTHMIVMIHVIFFSFTQIRAHIDFKFIHNCLFTDVRKLSMFPFDYLLKVKLIKLIVNISQNVKQKRRDMSDTKTILMWNASLRL